MININMSNQAILNHINQNIKIKLRTIYKDEDKTDVYSLQKYEDKEQITNKKRKITQQVAQQVPKQVAPPEKVIIKDLLTNKVYNSWYSLLHSEEIETVKSQPAIQLSPKLASISMNPPIFLPNQVISIHRDPVQKLSDFLLADDYQIPEVYNEQCCNEDDCFFTHLYNH